MTPKQLVIDGYNLLGAMGHPPSQVIANGERYREELIVGLGLYGQRIHCPITLVFDAWQEAGLSRQNHHRAGVTVIYSAKGERADQVIQQLIRREGKDMAVVSSDREVMDVAKSFGAFSIRSQEFVRRLRPVYSQRSKVTQSGGSKTHEEGVELSVRSKDKKGNPRKLPKKLRQHNRIMRKF